MIHKSSALLLIICALFTIACISVPLSGFGQSSSSPLLPIDDKRANAIITASTCGGVRTPPLDPSIDLTDYYEIHGTARADLIQTALDLERRIDRYFYKVKEYNAALTPQPTDAARITALAVHRSKIVANHNYLKRKALEFCSLVDALALADPHEMAKQVQLGPTGYNEKIYADHLGKLADRRLSRIQKMYQGLIRAQLAPATTPDFKQLIEAESPKAHWDYTNLKEYFIWKAEELGYRFTSTERKALGLPIRGKWIITAVQKLTDGMMIGFQMMILSIIGALANLGFTILIILMVFAVFWAGYQLVFESGEVDRMIKSFVQLFILAGFVLLLLNPVESSLFMGKGFETHPRLGAEMPNVERDDDADIHIEVPMMFELATRLQINLENILYGELCDLAATDLDNPAKTQWNVPILNVTGDPDEGVGDTDRARSASEWLANHPCNDEMKKMREGRVPMGNPGMIFAYGTSNAIQLFDLANHPDASHNILDIGERLALALMVTLSSLITLILYFLLAMLFLMVWLEGFAVVGIGIFILGLGAHQWSRDKAISYIWYSIGWAVRVGMLMFTYFLFHAAFNVGLNSMGLSELFVEGGEVELLTAFMYCIIKIFEPFMLATLAFTVNNKIGGFFGSTSDAGGQMLGMMNRVSSQGMTMMAAAATAPVVMPLKAAGGVAGNAASSVVSGAASGVANRISNSVSGISGGTPDGGAGGTPGGGGAGGGSNGLNAGRTMRPPSK